MFYHPMFYYIFNRPEQAPFFYLNSKADLSQLKKAKDVDGYCYFGDFVFQSYHNFYADKSLQKLYHWLNNNSKKIIRVNVPSYGFKGSYVKIYVG